MLNYPPKREQCVSFDANVTVRLVLNRQQYTDDETRRSFFCREDFHDFKHDVRLTLRKIQNNEFVDETSNSNSIRGAEHYLRDAVKIRSNIRKTAYFAVQRAQTKQILSGLDCYDPEEIASVYAPYSRLSTAAAYRRGCLDEMVAKELATLEQQHVVPVIARGGKQTRKKEAYSFSPQSNKKPTRWISRNSLIRKNIQCTM